MTQLHVIAAGEFGHAVATELAAVWPSTSVTSAPGLRIWTAELPVADLYVLAAWRPIPTLAAILDDVAHAWRVPWLPIVAEHPLVRIGPTVVPGAGPCYGCFRGRLRQHSLSPEVDRVLDSVYQYRPEPGPSGYLPSTATLVAMAAADALEACVRAPDREAGRVRQYDIVAQRATTGRAVGVHGCARCGLQRDERTRSSEPLLSEVRRLLSWTA